MQKLKMLALTLGVMVGVFCSFSFGMKGSCLSEAAKSSVYLPRDSWVIARVEAKMQQKGRIPQDNWKEKTMVSYSYLQGNVENNNIIAVLDNTTAHLAVPIKEGGDIDPTIVSVALKFFKPVENIDAVVRAQLPPKDTDGSEIPCEISTWNPGSNGYFRDMQSIEAAERNVQLPFLFNNEETKLYSVGLGVYSSGYILIDSRGQMLFWCNRAFDSFKKNQFYNLGDVLTGYRNYVARKSLSRGPHWI
ncbi:MAG: hypothetical protein LBF82_03015 [Lactobacillales bacterium]|nr:hypothetical protein [Lactobacillales bacterium]